MHTIAATLGIEAARTFIIRSLYNVISNTGSYVHPANIMFIAEFITNRGEPYGATYTGISRGQGGHLSLATLERAGKVFTQNALHGRKEDIRNVSASVSVGTRMAIGDGFFDIGQHITENGNQVMLINDDLFTSHNRDDNIANMRQPPGETLTLDDITQGLDEIKNINLGVTFDYAGGEDEANLINAFNPEEAINEINTLRPLAPGTPKKIVRRVTKHPVQTVDIPHDLIDVLSQNKIGVPLPDGQPLITIKPLVTGITQQPLLTNGIIPVNELIPINTDNVFDEINELMNELEPEPVELQPQPDTVKGLPEVPIPTLPLLTGANLTQTMINLRREQVRNLEPINVTKLQQSLNK
jgi:hypothetical protein